MSRLGLLIWNRCVQKTHQIGFLKKNLGYLNFKNLAQEAIIISPWGLKIALCVTGRQSFPLLFTTDIHGAFTLVLSNLSNLLSALVVMNHLKASGSASSSEVPSSTDVRRPLPAETMEMTDRNTIYRSHDYEELPTSRFLHFKFSVRLVIHYYSTGTDIFLMLQYVQLLSAMTL